MENRGWVLEDIDLDTLRNLAISYSERDPETAIPALRRITDVVEAETKEGKDCVQLLRLSKDKHPLPTFSGEEEKAALISHLIDVMGVLESDFSMMKNHMAKWDLKIGIKFEITSSVLVAGFRAKTLKKVDALVLKEFMAKKAEDFELLVWNVKTRTLDLMLGLVVGTLQDANQLGSLEKLKRIEKCLCDVISDGIVFTLTHNFMPQPDFYPVIQVSQSMEQEQHVSNAQGLIDLLVEFLDLIGDCKLRKDELDKAWDLVTRMKADLEGRAFAEGGLYQDN